MNAATTGRHLALALTLALALAGCALEYEYEGDASAERYEPTWDGVALLLEHRCMNCHGHEPGAGGVSLPGDLVGDLMSGAHNLVVPGDAEGSPLWQVLAEGRMPTGNRALPMAEIEHLRVWIERGAVLP
ncbi:c-type cytochrome domain-containing protein [Haliangium ochraceum]|uniref:Cytochrome C Planctomycete-type domain-containing protein n=1 Tax=Haliangium ochraceum (strain DSM 14365 / JCM 11303 / SMP-2) TaxID=502025 RepID=D0LTB7_HALO1|nr:c-type cytochrome domain-containing protein [Haliangium ochraceum]ACY13812.1 hypothetical protein Hoch_1252 [Haliangium ochraceum DSM 14365]